MSADKPAYKPRFRAVKADPKLRDIDSTHVKVFGPDPKITAAVGVRRLYPDEMWRNGFSGSGITVAVIDSGIDGSHPEFAGRYLGRIDMLPELASTPIDEHGTHVAGTICAGGVIKGVAPGAKLLDIRVSYGKHEITQSLISKAINTAAEKGCHVINVSTGGAHTLELEQAVREARAKGCVIVCSAGNDGDLNSKSDEWSFPASYPEAISVGSVTVKDSTYVTSDWSNAAYEVDCCSSGEEIYSAVPGGKYEVMDGTSMAAPHISGLAALLYQRKLKEGFPQNLDTAIIVIEEVFGLAKRIPHIDLHVQGRGFPTFAVDLINE